MAKNKKAPPRHENRAAADYYKLNTQAIEDLVTADESNSPAVSEEELRRYQSGPKVKVSHWLKVVLIKAWFAGAVCFFIIWGLGVYLPNSLDQLFVTGIALGFVLDILVNNLLHFMEKTPGANDRWMMFPKKGFITLPLNVLYCYVLLLLVVTTYQAINMGIMALTGVQDKLALGVEPILFGVFVMGWDTLLLQMKQALRRIIADAKKQARSR